jgi:hypothetical protein
VVLLRAVHRGRGAGVITLRVSVKPCAGNSGRRVELKRGGRTLKSKRLNRRCIVRFRVRVKRRANFRAVLKLGPASGTVRSSRLVLRAND